MNIDKTLEERGNNYGDFRIHADITVSLKQAVRRGPSWYSMSSDKQEAIDMILHKIARIVNGDPDYKDSWTDIIGYAHLIEKDL